MRRIKIIFAVLIVFAIALCFAGCNEKGQIKKEADSVKVDISNELSKEGITEFTIAEELTRNSNVSCEAYNIIVDIPSFEDMDDQSKLSLLNDLHDCGKGFFLNNSTDENDFVMLYVVVTSHNNEYTAFDHYDYYRNGNTIHVNEQPTTTTSGNYDKDDPYYSANDYNNDGYINQYEFQGAVGDYMDSHGY